MSNRDFPSLSVFPLCQSAIEELTWKDRLPGYFINVSSILLMVGTENQRLTKM